MNLSAHKHDRLITPFLLPNRVQANSLSHNFASTTHSEYIFLACSLACQHRYSKMDQIMQGNKHSLLGMPIRRTSNNLSWGGGGPMRHLGGMSTCISCIIYLTKHIVEGGGISVTPPANNAARGMDSSCFCLDMSDLASVTFFSRQPYK